MTPTAGSIASSLVSRPAPISVAALADLFGVDGGDVAGARRGDFAHAGGVGQQVEAVEHLRVAALRRDHFLQLAVAGAVEQFLLRRVRGLLRASP